MYTHLAPLTKGAGWVLRCVQRCRALDEGHLPRWWRARCAVTVTVGAYTSRYGRGGPGLRLLGGSAVNVFRWAVPRWASRGHAPRSLLPAADSPIESGAKVE